MQMCLTNVNNTTVEVKDSETSLTDLSNDKNLGNNSNDNQKVFRLRPSYCSTMGGDSIDDSSVVAKIDWSRESLKQLAMLKVTMDPNQNKITDYYKLLDKMELLMRSNSEYDNIIKEANKLHRERLTTYLPELATEKISPLFKQLLENITVNADKVPQAKRHDHIIKKFSTSVLIYTGPRAYNFLQRNIDGLPCLRTVQRII